MNTADLPVISARARALRATREFFWARGFREIDTPLLSSALIPESTIEAWAAEYIDHTGRRRPRYLIPSPEIWMKRLLALGSGDIFQITKCFRNAEPPTGAHHPEFTMLEWYAVKKTYLDSLALQEEYFDAVRTELGVGGRVSVGGHPVDLTPPFRRLTLCQAFRDLADIDLESLLAPGALEEQADALGVHRQPSDTWESLFHKLFLTRVEPRLPADRPLFLLDYPAALPTLAQASADGRFVERWELYVGGLEVANCYTEERNPARIKAFFKQEEAKKRSAAVPYPADWEGAELMSRLLPASSGNALGFDRLLMVLLEKKTIQEVIPFGGDW